jgi:hypothetical protein
MVFVAHILVHVLCTYGAQFPFKVISVEAFEEQILLKFYLVDLTLPVILSCRFDPVCNPRKGNSPGGGCVR